MWRVHLPRIKVFVSSRMYELEPEREIAPEIVRELGFEPILFEDMPATPRTPQQAFLDGVTRCDIFVMILWTGYSKAVRREYECADSLGKPILIFIKDLRGKKETREKRLENFMKKIHFYKRFRKLADLRSQLREGLIEEVSRRYRERPKRFDNIKDVYEEATRVAKEAQKRLCIIQWTPSLILGAHPYERSEKVHYEGGFEEIIENWARRVKNNRRRTFIYAYYAPFTREDISEYGLEERARNNLKKYKELEILSGGRFKLLSITGPYPPPIIEVGDDNYGIWFRSTERSNVASMVQKDKYVAEILVNLVLQLSERDKTEDELLQELGIDKC